jgi:hypothetical protein
MNSNMKIISTLAFSLCSTYAFASSSWVLGVQYGNGASNISTGSSISTNKGSSYYGGTIGYDTDILKTFVIGLETGYFQGYLASVSNQKVKNQIIPILIKGKLHLPLGFNLFAKTGVAWVKPESNSTYNWKNTWNYTAAGGIGYQFFSFDLFAQYMQIFGKGEIQGGSSGYSSNVKAITGGISYNF